jgi:diadenosine tetraphosphatase ApaH/serine/threonine PP2A family protein phosphatase
VLYTIAGGNDVDQLGILGSGFFCHLVPLCGHCMDLLRPTLDGTDRTGDNSGWFSAPLPVGWTRCANDLGQRTGSVLDLALV